MEVFRDGDLVPLRTIAKGTLDETQIGLADPGERAITVGVMGHNNAHNNGAKPPKPVRPVSESGMLCHAMIGLVLLNLSDDHRDALAEHAALPASVLAQTSKGKGV